MVSLSISVVFMAVLPFEKNISKCRFFRRADRPGYLYFSDVVFARKDDIPPRGLCQQVFLHKKRRMPHLLFKMTHSSLLSVKYYILLVLIQLLWKKIFYPHLPHSRRNFYKNHGVRANIVNVCLADAVWHNHSPAGLTFDGNHRRNLSLSSGNCPAYCRLLGS